MPHEHVPWRVYFVREGQDRRHPGSPSLATDKDFEDLIVERGAVHAFVDLMRTGVRHDVNAAAYARVRISWTPRAARRVLAVEGGVQVCVCLLIRCQPTP